MTYFFPHKEYKRKKRRSLGAWPRFPAHTGSPSTGSPRFPVQSPRRSEWEKPARCQTSDCRSVPISMCPEQVAVCRGWAKAAADGAEKDWAGDVKEQRN